MRHPVAGVVLAGGRSTRMGADKASLPWAGGTMLGAVTGALHGSCAQVFVVAARGQHLPEVPATVLRDEQPGLGPLHGLAVGLDAAARHGHSWAFVCATDMPLLDGGVVDALVAAQAAAPRALVLLASDGRRGQSLAALYSTQLGRAARAALDGGRRSLHGLVGAVRHQVVALPEPWRLAGANTPEEWELARRRAQGGR